MPLYEYLCEACGRTSEVLRRFDDPPLESCPHCGGKVKKQMSAPAFHLKGTGWYATDYAKKSSEGGKAGATKSDAATGSSESAGGEAAGATKSDSNSEPKSASKSESASESKSESKSSEAKPGDAKS